MAVLAGWEAPVDRVSTRRAGPDPTSLAGPSAAHLRLVPVRERPAVQDEPLTDHPDDLVAPGRSPARPVRPAPRRRSSSRHRPVALAAAPVLRPGVASCEHVYRRRRITALLAVAVSAAAVVIGLALLGSAASDDGVPDRTAVVEVRAGESLWELAQRVAPHSPPDAVVARIRQLNDMRGSTLHPGQPLIVPAQN